MFCFPAHAAQTVEISQGELSFTATTAVKVNKSSKFSVIDSKAGELYFVFFPCLGQVRLSVVTSCTRT